ncbi:MAG TPA: glycosyltransferase [Vitreimonas sp.]|nr:glycosyltransferase [Vitreimonas sp.]
MSHTKAQKTGKIGVKYTGAFLDFSGYGEATRHDIGALHEAGIAIQTEYVHFTHEVADYGRLGSLCKRLQNISENYRIKILHLTPNIFPRFKEEGCYMIGRVFWETDKLPPDFAQGCEVLDEIWTGSETNKKAIVNAGVNKPIFIIPEAIETTVFPPEPYQESVINGKFAFYSIFEWTTRKNPDALLRAYFQEFNEQDNVCLMLKTYVDDFTSNKKDEIKSEIKAIIASLNLSYRPPIYLYTDLMDRHQVHRFHASGDCFISTTRGEGWGVPQMEAMLFGKPVITTQSGGIADYLTHEESAHILPTFPERITHSSRNSQWYRSDQNWSGVLIKDVREAMRKIYSDAEYRNKIAEGGNKLVKERFSLSAVGELMKSRLEEI